MDTWSRSSPCEGVAVPAGAPAGAPAGHAMGLSATTGLSVSTQPGPAFGPSTRDPPTEPNTGVQGSSDSLDCGLRVLGSGPVTGTGRAPETAAVPGEMETLGATLWLTGLVSHP